MSDQRTITVEALAAACHDLRMDRGSCHHMDGYEPQDGWDCWFDATAIFAALPATPADAGLRAQEDDMCLNCVTPWKCNGPHLAATPVGEE